RSVIVDSNDCRKLSIGDTEGTIWCTELNPVVRAEHAPLLLEDLDSGQARGIVTNGLPSFILHHDLVPFRIDCFDPGVTSALDTQARTSPPESEHVADLVTLSAFTLRPGQLALYEHDLFSSVGADMPAFFVGRAHC